MTDPSTHKVRRTFSVVSGIFAVIFFTLGVVSQSLLGFVGSAEDVRDAVTSNISKPAVRDLIADKLVEKVEEESDLKKDPVTGIIFSVARNVVVESVSQKMTEPAVKEFAGDVAAKMYAVFVDDETVEPIDLTIFADSARDAIISVDPKVGKEFNPKFDPLEVTKEDGPDLGAMRDLAKNVSWLLLIAGVLLFGLTWWLQLANNMKKIRRIGIFVSVIGLLGIAVTMLARNIIPNFSEDETEALSVGAKIATSPLLTRGIVILALGIISIVTAEVLRRRESNESISA